MLLSAKIRFMLLILATPLLACCGIYTPLQIEPARKAPAVSPRFSESYYAYDRDRTVSFIMRSQGTDEASGKPIEQIATIRVFWRPKGGVTTINASALNATLRYVVMTPDSMGIYEGAGFVLLNSATGAGKMHARVMDSDLRLTQKSASFLDTLGRARMKGAFAAAFNDEKTAQLMLEAQQEFFGNSLNSKPATLPAAPPAMTSPATAPATSPASTLP
jgi:hypothetical protein